MKKSKILFIDDDRDFVEANKIILNNAGYERPECRRRLMKSRI
jgi:DNA-binding NtrC family response regulator